MPNYNGKSPLKMKCPRCGTYDAHPVVHTFPEHYRWSDRATALFEKISDGDLSFRQRRKRCTSCNTSFLSVEMSKHFLPDIIDHVHRLDGEWASLHSQNAEQKKEIERLRGVVERVHALTYES